MSHDTVILKIFGGTLHELLGSGDLVIPRGMERISDSGYLSLDMMPPCIDSITVEDGNSSFYAKNNCLIRKEDGELVLGCRNSVIPDDGSVRSIGALAFNAAGADYSDVRGAHWPLRLHGAGGAPSDAAGGPAVRGAAGIHDRDGR